MGVTGSSFLCPLTLRYLLNGNEMQLHISFDLSAFHFVCGQEDCECNRSKEPFLFFATDTRVRGGSIFVTSPL